MNASKTMLAAIGGVSAVAILTAGYFTWSAYSEKTTAMDGDDEEGVAGLETVRNEAESLSRKKVYPCREAVQAVKSNETAIAAWKDEALRLAAHGDRAYKAMTASEFKSFLESDAKRIAALPGGVMLPGVADPVLIKPGFEFGPFKEFIIEGKMPQEDAAKIAVLRRRWDDLSTVAEILSAGGVSEIIDFKLKEEKTVEEPQNDKKRQRSAKKPAKKPAKGAPVARKEPSAEKYVFGFRASPAAFVKALNALETCERFAVVENFTFEREKDAIAAAFGGSETQKEERKTTRRRSRRGGGAAVAQAPVEEKKDAARGNVITDPQLDGSLKVVMTVAVYDFRSLEEEVSK